MKAKSTVSLVTMTILALSMFICSCGGPESPDASGNVPNDQAPAAQAGEDTSQTDFEEAELPEDFPADFPIPDGARVGSAVTPAGTGFRVYLALPFSIDECLTYYREELPAAGWKITAETESQGNPVLEIAGQDYTGDLLFLAADTGVGLEIALNSSEAAEGQPDVPDDMGESTTLGSAAGEFPGDFPLPASFQPVQVMGILEEQGYQLAYSYQGLPELALADLTMALINGGWEVGDPALEGNQRAYRVPFENPATGFQGHALISNEPAVVGSESQSLTIIAFKSGE